MKLIPFLFSNILKLPPNKRKLIRVFIDAFLLLSSIISFSFLFLEIFDITFYENIRLIFFLLIIGLPLYYLTGEYVSLTRYLGSFSFYKLALRNLFIIFSLFILGYAFNFYRLPINGWIIIYLFITGFTGLARFIIRDLLINQNILKSREKTKVAIYGAGSAGAQLLSSLKISGHYKILSFLDDAPQLWKRSLNGININRPEVLNLLTEEIDQVLLAIPSLSRQKRRDILRRLQKYDIPVLQIPSIEEIAIGKAKIDNLRPISIEDLLGRDKVMPDPNLLGPGIKGQTICVTGAGGSIGSELCRQILKLGPKKIVLLDISEPNLYLIEQEIIKIIPKETDIVTTLGSATDFKLLQNLFVEEQVNIVFHAAAYKHVPLVENNPIQAIFNNVISTKEVCKASKIAGCKKVILISTDKAVRPSNILGASKRLSELVVQAFAEEENLTSKDSGVKTIFTMVRFGNVLGSSGSVVPLFQKQIKNGGPITLTHPEIIRYFMTIAEAAQLVIQSAVLAEGGEVFLLDMGEPVKIYDLACQIIKLSGLKIKNETKNDKDVEIITTGLRPGEKLYEELLIDAKAIKTTHNLIYKANEKSIKPSFLWKELNHLEVELKNYNIKVVLSKLKELVPEWEKVYQKK